MTDWRKNLEEIGGYENELIGVPAGAVRLMVDEIERLREELATRNDDVRVEQGWVKHWADECAARDLVIEQQQSLLRKAFWLLDDGEEKEVGTLTIPHDPANYICTEIESILRMQPSTDALKLRDQKRDAALLLAVCAYCLDDEGIKAKADQRLSGGWEPELEIK